VPEPVTSHVGRYENDKSTDTSEDYGYPALPFTGNQIILTCRDYGGSITLHASAVILVGTETIPLDRDFTLPKDSDGDGLPDIKEIEYGTNPTNPDTDNDGVSDDLEDMDVSVDPKDATKTGDNKTNFEEYRGYKWGQLEPYPGTNPIGSAQDGFVYQTETLEPTGTIVHFRPDWDKKDLYVKYSGYNNDYPFVIGTAFYKANIMVHAVDSATAASFDDGSGGGPGLGVTNVDYVTITHVPGTRSNVDGNINKREGRRNYRDWYWDTKGWSNIGIDGLYGSGTRTYETPLRFYFSDRPYWDGCTLDMTGTNCMPGSIPSGVLEPRGDVEDENDDGELGGQEDKRISINGVLDGDHAVKKEDPEDPNQEVWVYDQQLTTFDIDNDGYVELPVETIVPVTGIEYTRNQVLKHTITHEIGHAIGMHHSTTGSDLMYEWTTSWDKDGDSGGFSDDALAEVKIH
jgi:hypothetical protein